MSTKTALFLLALMLIALHFALKMEPTPLTEAEKARIEAEAQKDTEYFVAPDGEVVIRTAIFKVPKDKPVFLIYRECTIQQLINNQRRIVDVKLRPEFRIEFGETLRERYNKRKVEQISTE